VGYTVEVDKPVDLTAAMESVGGTTRYQVSTQATAA
jgi:hypothetical protein